MWQILRIMMILFLGSINGNTQDAYVGYHYNSPVKVWLLPVAEHPNHPMTLHFGSLKKTPPLQLEDLKGQNHEINPYFTVLLSRYGRYLPLHGATGQKGLYFHAAANNYHNNKAFGSYKVHEEVR